MSLFAYSVLVCLLGGAILLDKWAFGEFGVSQPIVSCPLLGLIFGDFANGLFLGAALQLVWTEALPLGGERPADYQTAGVSGAAAYFLARREWLGHSAQAWPGLQNQALFASMLLAALATIAGQYSDHLVKHLNAGIYRLGLRATRQSGVIAAQLLGLGTSFLRGVLLVAGFLAVMAVLAPHLGRLPRFKHAELLVFPLAIGLAALIRLFVRRRRIPLVVAGAVASGIVWLFWR